MLYGINIEPFPDKYKDLVKFRQRDINLQIGVGKMKENKTLSLLGVGSIIINNNETKSNNSIKIEVDTMSNNM
jgi:hypothetical protein